MRWILLLSLCWLCLGHQSVTAIATETNRFLLSRDPQAIALTEADLPARFSPAPAFVEKLILQIINSINPNLAREGIKIDQISTFVDVAQAEMVLALTTDLPNPQAVKKFDTGLRHPNAQALFVQGLQQTVSSFGQAKMTSVQELTNLQNIGQVARGFQMTAAIEGKSLTLASEAIAFRRGNKGALIILGSLDSLSNDIQARDLAQRYDQRLLSLSQAK